MVEFLISQGADVNRKDNEGWTPLHVTASCDLLSIASFLIESGADLGSINSDGDLPIDLVQSDEMRDLIQKHVNEQGKYFFFFVCIIFLTHFSKNIILQF